MNSYIAKLNYVTLNQLIQAAGLAMLAIFTLILVHVLIVGVIHLIRRRARPMRFMVRLKRSFLYFPLLATGLFAAAMLAASVTYYAYPEANILFQPWKY